MNPSPDKMSVNTRESSATFANASLVDYHFSRYFNTSVHVPVTVFHSTDRREHTRRVSSKGVSLSAGKPALKMNHDASAYPGFARERDAYREEWLSRVLFISLDVTTVGAIEPEQKRWLDELLRKHGAGYRHRVVFSHLPIYPFAQGRETEISADHELAAILERHGVEMSLSGHHHAFYPGYHGGVRHVNQGCLGAGPRTITLLEFPDEGEPRITALTGPGFGQTLDFRQLPERIVSRHGTLLRDDLREAPGSAPRVAATRANPQGH